MMYLDVKLESKQTNISSFLFRRGNPLHHRIKGETYYEYKKYHF